MTHYILEIVILCCEQFLRKMAPTVADFSGSKSQTNAGQIVKVKLSNHMVLCKCVVKQNMYSTYCIWFGEQMFTVMHQKLL